MQNRSITGSQRSWRVFLKHRETKKEEQLTQIIFVGDAESPDNAYKKAIAKRLCESWSTGQITEKAVVTGRQCAAALAADLGLAGVDAHIEPAARDTAQLAALRAAARALRSLPNFPELPPPAPWASLLRR